MDADLNVPPWRNWQTRMIQVHVPVRAWWFDSTRRHSRFSVLTVDCSKTMLDSLQLERDSFSYSSSHNERIKYIERIT